MGAGIPGNLCNSQHTSKGTGQLDLLTLVATSNILLCKQCLLEDKILQVNNMTEIFRLLKILGLISVLSYMIVILFTWMYANHLGYVYFSAGEPISFIKYPEWVLGFLGILATASVLRKELDNLIC